MKLTKQNIQTGNPTEQGMYIAYTEHRHSQVLIERVLLMYVGYSWSYPSSDQLFRGKIYGWIGPLPILKLEDIESEDLPIKYAIALDIDGYHGAFLNGPFESLDEALDCVGEEGHYIYELYLDKESKRIRKWSEGKNKWIGRKK